MAYDKERARSEYAQKLRDPRWQKKRLEVMQRDEFACQYCQDKETTLNVHHNYYVNPPIDPWEYPLESLVTLCEPCHQSETETRRGNEQLLLEVLRRCGMNSGTVIALAETLQERFGTWPAFSDYDEFVLTWAIKNLVKVRDLMESSWPKKNKTDQTKEGPDA